MAASLSRTLLLALVALASLSTLCLAQYPPVTWGPGCEWVSLDCKNGGKFNMSDCNYYTNCGIDAPFPLWFNQHNCTCPPHFSGTDCGIITSPLKNPDKKDICADEGLVWDGSMVNANASNKHVECFIDVCQGAPDCPFLFRQHRINVSVSLDKTGHGSIHFRLWSRHRNNSMDSGDPHHSDCIPSATDLDCMLTDCTGATVGTQPEYHCDTAVCDSCGNPKYNNPSCSPLVYAIAMSITGPVDLQFPYVEPQNGYARLDLLMGSVQFQGACYTGQCFGSIDNLHKSPPDHRWMLALLIGMPVLTALFLFWSGYYLNRGRLDGKWVKVDSGGRFESSGSGALLELLAEHRASLPRFGILFDRLTYTVEWRHMPFKPKTTRRILKGITGIIEPGQMVAILGSSGAGKSSLMSILSQRVQTGTVGGDVAMLCSSHRARAVGDVISFVVQDDHLMTTQTVREALLFSARLRLPRSFSEAALNARVARVISDLRLEKVADSYIGSSDHGGGISGGERKRLSIGMELIADPRILLLDEPTSGLDSVSAHIVMQVLRQVASDGCAVLMSIHQPPAKVFALFDSVLLLTRLGEQAFFGPPAEALEHFRQLHYAPAEKHMNPAEYLMDVASHESNERLEELPHAFYNSAAYQALARRIADARVGGALEPYQTLALRPDSFKEEGFGSARSAASGQGKQPLSDGHEDEEETKTYDQGARLFQGVDSAEAPEEEEKVAHHSPAMIRHDADGANGIACRSGADLPLFSPNQTSSMGKFALLCGRALINIMRDPSLLLVQWLVTVLVALLIGLIFMNVSADLSGMQNRAGVLFFMVLYFSLLSMSSMGSLLRDRVLFIRERSARFYTTFPYFLSKLLCDFIPLRILPPYVFAAVCYFLIGLHPDYGNFGVFVALLIFTNMVATAACFLVTALFSKLGHANLLVVLFLVYSMLFGGLLVSNESDSSMLPLRYGSFFHYAWEALMINEFTGLSLLFNPKGYGSQQVQGEAVLINFGLDQHSLYFDMGMLAALCAFFLFSTYVLLLPSEPRVEWSKEGPQPIELLLNARRPANGQAPNGEQGIRRNLSSDDLPSVSELSSPSMYAAHIKTL